MNDLELETIIQSAMEKKNKKGRQQVHLPGHWTPFYQALGVDFTYSPSQGVKVTVSLYSEPADLEDALPLSWDAAVFERLIEAARSIKADGYPLLYKFPSILNVLEGLLPFEQTIKLSLKKPELLEALMAEIIEKQADLASDLGRVGVDQLYFFDSFASLDLLGPSFYQKVYGPACLRLLSQVQHASPCPVIVGPEIVQPLHQIGAFSEEGDRPIYSRRLDRSGDLWPGQVLYLNLKGSDRACN